MIERIRKNEKMKITTATYSAAFAIAAATVPAFGQDMTALQMPEICSSTETMEGMDHSSMGHGASEAGTEEAMDSMSDHAAGDVPAHVTENMRRMMITMPAMEEGMMKEDADIAFACGMIAHHKAAIDMAQVLLEFGDDPQMVELAGEIIAAQVGEIDRMTDWLANTTE